MEREQRFKRRSPGNKAGLQGERCRNVHGQNDKKIADERKQKDGQADKDRQVETGEIEEDR